MQTNSFKSAVRATIAAIPLGDLLATKAAVVLERVARGGGATRWYYCSDQSRLSLIEDRLSPSSVVSFYFDDRIRNDSYSPGVKAAIEEVITRNHEAVVGTLGDDGVSINAEIVTGPNELAELASEIKPGSRVFYGAFPARTTMGCGRSR